MGPYRPRMRRKLDVAPTGKSCRALISVITCTVLGLYFVYVCMYVCTRYLISGRKCMSYIMFQGTNVLYVFMEVALLRRGETWKSTGCLIKYWSSILFTKGVGVGTSTFGERNKMLVVVGGGRCSAILRTGAGTGPAVERCRDGWPKGECVTPQPLSLSLSLSTPPPPPCFVSKGMRCQWSNGKQQLSESSPPTPYSTSDSAELTADEFAM